MSKSSNKILLSLTFLLVIGVIAITGYIFINQQTQEKLPELKKETVRVNFEASKTPLSLKRTRPSLQPRNLNINLSNQSPIEKNSSFYLQANRQNIQVGETTNLNVYVEAEGEVVDGVEFVLSYNSDLVKINSPVLGTFFSLYPQKEVNPQKEVVKVIAFQKVNEYKKLTNALVISLPVEALRPGTADFVFQQEKTKIAAYGGQNILKEITPLTLKIE